MGLDLSLSEKEKEKTVCERERGTENEIRERDSWPLPPLTAWPPPLILRAASIGVSIGEVPCFLDGGCVLCVWDG